MSKQNRDGLEEFFNKGTQKYDFEFNEADWNKLEKKLDQADSGVAMPFWKRNGKILLLSVLIIIGIILSFYFYLDNNQLINKSLEASTSSDKIKLPLQSERLRPKENKNTIQEKSSQSIHLNENAMVDENHDLNSSFNGASTPSTGSTKLLDNSGISSSDTKYFGEDSGDKKQYVGGEVPGSGNSLRESTDIPFLNSIGLETEPFHYHAPLWSWDKTDTIQVINEKEDAKKFDPNLSVAIALAPDFSTVGIGNFSSPGTRLGLLLSYQFHPRWSIRAGGILTNNIYKARGDQYHAPEAWYGSAKPIRAEGACKIVDIPINLRYNLIRGDKHTFYLTAGANSYVMLKEKYDFEYEYAQPYDMEYWESDKTTEHLFGLVNVSTGWEYHMASKWSLQVEPFINVPLSGIGWGSVDLYSFGSYFSIKYELFRNEK